MSRCCQRRWCVLAAVYVVVVRQTPGVAALAAPRATPRTTSATRRESLAQTLGLLSTAALGVVVTPKESTAIGPETIELTELKYADTGKKVGEICAGRPLKVPGEKAAEGLLPKCVSVKATASNPNPRKAAKDASVFGYVKTATGDSAVANNPDFRSDAGQFAMIPLVPPGESQVDFEFVAVIPDSESDLGELRFENVKALSYPGGARMAPLTECELDSLSDACDEEQQRFISK